MSRQAVAYAQRIRIADERAQRVFLLLAERTPALGDPRDGEPPVMGLELPDADIPALAARAGIDAAEFRRLLRVLKQTVPMDVLEHADGVWEIVYGPSYTDRKKPAPGSGASREASDGAPQAFWMPGWDHYSTWGYEDGLGHLYAQIIHNQDGPDAEPRIWITPPQYLVRTVDELAQAIADAIAPYAPVPPPAAVIKMWLSAPPAHRAR
ncbi:hypothetical protein [Streptomyces sp. NBC_01262]|uniref:hypothetical protein n=1 Tax=Streptomyces sp. NBC_01262 TaxID=2903803 RepID=UPI002E37FACE|nr:hypothetical protein [Streptomyces sp. NBC_01262]